MAVLPCDQKNIGRNNEVTSLPSWPGRKAGFPSSISLMVVGVGGPYRRPKHKMKTYVIYVTLKQRNKKLK